MSRHAFRRLGLLAGALLITACTHAAAGLATVAPYAPLSLPRIHAAAVPVRSDSLLAVSPDGGLVATFVAGHGVCVQAVNSAGPRSCTSAGLGSAPPDRTPPNLSAAFSPGSQWLAIGVDVTGIGPGSVWLQNVSTGGVSAVAAVAGVAPRPAPSNSAPSETTPSETAPTETPPTETAPPDRAPTETAPADRAPSETAPADRAPTETAPADRPPTKTAPADRAPKRTDPAPADPYRSGGAYQAMAWNESSGHLVLINLLISDAGPSSRIVDVDPQTGISRLVGKISGALEGFSGYMSTRGTALLAGVYQENQMPADLMVADLAAGTARNVGLVVPKDSSAQPLAVSPDGMRAIIGPSSYGATGPPEQFNLSTGSVSALPGLSGDFAVAAYSPDGSQVATLSSGADGPVRLAVSQADGSAASRVLTTTTGTIDSRARLSWSTSNVIAVTGAVGGIQLAVASWHLIG